MPIQQHPSKLDLPATAPQLILITRLSWALGEKYHTEDIRMTRGVAGRTIRTMIAELRTKRLARSTSH